MSQNQTQTVQITLTPRGIAEDLLAAIEVIEGSADVFIDTLDPISAAMIAAQFTAWEAATGRHEQDGPSDRADFQRRIDLFKTEAEAILRGDVEYDLAPVA